MTNAVSDVQFWNARAPMLVTVLGIIDMSVCVAPPERLAHPANMSSMTYVSPSATSADSMLA